MIEADWIESRDLTNMLMHLAYMAESVIASNQGAPLTHILRERKPPIVSTRKLNLILEAWTSGLCGDERKTMGLLEGQELPAPWTDLFGEALNMVGREFKNIAAAIMRDIVGNPWKPVVLPAGPLIPCQTCRGWDGYNERCPTCHGKDWIPGPCPWLTPTVLALAGVAYDERVERLSAEQQYERFTTGIGTTNYRCLICGYVATGKLKENHRRYCTGSGTLDPDRLAVLSDALEEAGGNDPICPNCKDADFKTGSLGHRLIPEISRYCAAQCVCKGTRRAPGILSHLRSPGPHVRGCWVVDLILGLE